MYSYCMIFEVTRLRREGAILPKFRESLFVATTGNLVIADYHDDIGRRWMRRATLLDQSTGRPIETIPPLLDASIVAVARDYMTITGFERIKNPFEDRFYDYQQTWYVTPCTI